MRALLVFEFSYRCYISKYVLYTVDKESITDNKTKIRAHNSVITAQLYADGNL